MYVKRFLWISKLRCDPVKVKLFDLMWFNMHLTPSYLNNLNEILKHLL